MSSTSFGSDTKVIKNKVNGYRYSPDGLQKANLLNYYIPYSAGALSSSTEDLLVWMRALHTGKVLSEPMYLSMISPGKLNDGTAVSYAKGLVNFSNYGHNVIAHTGGIPGFLSDTRYLPDNDLYIICIVNTIGPRERGGSFFADGMTWKLLEKKEYEKVALDIDTNPLQGTYRGQIRRAEQSIEIASIENGITRQTIGEEQIDTLTVYVGNNTWMDGNDKISIENTEYRVDKQYNYYILKKEK